MQDETQRTSKPVIYANLPDIPISWSPEEGIYTIVPIGELYMKTFESEGKIEISRTLNISVPSDNGPITHYWRIGESGPDGKYGQLKAIGIRRQATGEAGLNGCRLQVEVTGSGQKKRYTISEAE